jgi:hypothetical protein
MAKLMVAAAALLLAAGRAADEELDKAAAKAGEMGNYTCTISTKVEGGGGGGGGAGGGDAPQPVEMKIQADSPIYLKSGEIEVYRKGEALATKSGDTWKRPERPAQGERPDRATMAAMRLRGVKAPHESLKTLNSSAFKEVKREDADGGKVFSGELTDEALKSFAMGGGRRPGGGGGEDRPAPKSKGTAKIWVNGDGVVTKYETFIEMTRTGRDDQEITTKVTRTVELKDVGSTKYEVPADAAKALEPQRAEK